MNTLKEIYQRYAPDLYRFSLGLSGDPAWADDLVSETFVRALASNKPIELETVKAYLFTIARNLYFQQLRKEKRFLPLEPQLASRPVVHDKQEPERVSQKNDELLVVLEALQTLSIEERTILLMRAFDELPYADIAKVLDLSLASVKVKIFRARRKLTALLEEQNNENN